MRTACWLEERDFIKCRSLLGHFHHFPSASGGAKKPHKRMDDGVHNGKTAFYKPFKKQCFTNKKRLER